MTNTETLKAALASLKLTSLRNDEVEARYRPALIEARERGLVEFTDSAPVARWYLTDAGRALLVEREYPCQAEWDLTDVPSDRRWRRVRVTGEHIAASGRQWFEVVLDDEEYMAHPADLRFLED